MPEASDKGNMLLVGEDGTVRDVVSKQYIRGRALSWYQLLLSRGRAEEKGSLQLTQHRCSSASTRCQRTAAWVCKAGCGAAALIYRCRT